MIADAGSAMQNFSRREGIEGNPIDIPGKKGIGILAAFRAKNHLIFFGQDRRNIHGLPESNSQAFPLAYGVMLNPFMAAQNTSVLGYKFSFSRLFSCVFF